MDVANILNARNRRQKMLRNLRTTGIVVRTLVSVNGIHQNSLQRIFFNLPCLFRPLARVLLARSSGWW